MRYPIFILALCLLLSACGFQPLYGDNKGQANSIELAKIEIAPLAERGGQYLRQQLIDRMQPHGLQTPVTYVLTIKMNEAAGDQTIARDATVTRSFIRSTANYRLTNKKTGKVVIERTLIASNSYNNLFSEFGTLITEDDARTRNLDDLSERIAQQLSAYLAHPMQQEKPAAAKNPQDIKTGRKDIKDPYDMNGNTSNSSMSNWQ